MHTTTSVGLSDALSDLQSHMAALEDLRSCDADTEEEEQLVVGITSLAMYAILSTCQRIMSNSSPDMWSNIERMYIESCLDMALNNMENDAHEQ